jgi:hypothetical protein
LASPLDSPVLTVSATANEFSEQLVGLPEQRVDEARIVELRGVLNAGVQPRAAFDAVPAGELVHAEQIAVVEDQALRVFVRQLADLRFVRPHDQLGDRLDRLRAPGCTLMNG